MDEIKRVNYYNHQLLTEDDFKTEQNYHTSMRRRHNKSLHTWGLSQDSDFEVKKNGNKKINIMPGMALDNQGRDILLLSQQEINLSQFVLSGANKEVDLAVAFTENETDIDDRQDIDKPTRFTEKPKFIIYGGEFSGVNSSDDVETRKISMPLDGRVVPIAKITFDNSGSIKSIESTNRILAGARMGTLKHSDLVIDGGTNPHKTTAKDVEALSLKGGEIKGKLSITNGDLIVENAKQLAARIISKNRKGTGLLVRAQSGTTATKGEDAAVAAVSDTDKVLGLFASSNSPNTPAAKIVVGSRGKIALSVKGHIEVDGEILNGHTVDAFINTGNDFEIGDVVKLKGNKVSEFRGEINRIPMAEVMLADVEEDSSVIGIVAGEEIINQQNDEVNGKSKKEVHVVTIGVFSRCKVDAGDAPIKAGDLLTTSSNPGFAKKAVIPKTGTIIGKALEPLEEGAGIIPVFINIH